MRESTRQPALLFAGLFFAAGLGAGACFIESAQPSTFRFECSTTDDCQFGEVCSDGLCQQPCGEGQEACAQGTICLNGFCSSVCPMGQDLCPDPQECVSLSAPSLNEGGDEGGDEAETEDEPTSGICTVLCDPVERPCGEGQQCLLGFCANECVTVDDCGSGEECVPVGADVSVCVPSGSGGGGFP